MSLTYNNWFNTIHNLHRWKKFPVTFSRTFQTYAGLKTYGSTNHCEDWLKWKMKRTKIKQNHHSMFSITVILSGEQREPKYYSKDTTFGAKQYTAYLQRLDGILAGIYEKPVESFKVAWTKKRRIYLPKIRDGMYKYFVTVLR